MQRQHLFLNNISNLSYLQNYPEMISYNSYWAGKFKSRNKVSKLASGRHFEFENGLYRGS